MNLLLAGVFKFLVTSEKWYGNLFEWAMSVKSYTSVKETDVVLKDDL